MNDFVINNRINMIWVGDKSMCAPGLISVYFVTMKFHVRGSKNLLR